MKIEIKSFLNDSVLYSGEFENIKAAVVDAVKAGADLSVAYLSGADLSSADLRGADLSGANLSSADLSSADLSSADLDRKHCYISISPIGSENGCLWTIKNDDDVLIYNRGCFSGTEEEFISAVKKKHGGTQYEKIYMAAVELIKLRVAQMGEMYLTTSCHLQNSPEHNENNNTLG